MNLFELLYGSNYAKKLPLLASGPGGSYIADAPVPRAASSPILARGIANRIRTRAARGVPRALALVWSHACASVQTLEAT